MLKDIFREPIKEAQELIKQKYDKEELTNEVLDAQVALNKIRNALDIPDENEMVYEEYVQ